MTKIQESGECKSFLYGGCGGNLNNFESAEKCSLECVDQEIDCVSPADPGLCKGSVISYYFNKNSCKFGQ